MATLEDRNLLNRIPSTNINEAEREVVRTGDPREWPNGVYVLGSDPGTPRFQVWGGDVYSIGGPTLERLDSPSVFENEYRRVPGFTGRINRIEFEKGVSL